MAINLGTQTITFEQTSRTWRFQVDAPHGQPPKAEFWRETVRVTTDGVVTNYPASNAIAVSAMELDELTEYCEIPPELQKAIPNATALRKYLKLLPGLISIVGDAAERRQNATQ